MFYPNVQTPNKMFVRIREDLHEKWCREVKSEFFKIYTMYFMYCYKNHFNVSSFHWFLHFITSSRNIQLKVFVQGCLLICVHFLQLEEERL